MLPLNTAEILRNLNKTDIKKFGEFIKSPYFNSKETIHALYKLIEKNYPELKPEKFEYKKVYKKIYGESEYKEQTIKNLFSEFGGLLKKFIVCERLGANENDFMIFLIKGLSDKNCYEQSNKLIQNYKNNKDKFFISEEEYSYDLYNIDNILYLNLMKMNKIDLDEYYSIYNSINDNLIKFFIGILYTWTEQIYTVEKAHSIKPAKEHLSRAFMKSFKAEEFFEEFKNDKSISPVKLRYLAYKYTVNNVTEDEYQSIKKLFFENVKDFSATFILSIWANLLNIIILNLIPKDKRYYEEAFNLNEKCLGLNLYPNNAKEPMPVSIFRNVFGIALILKKYEWAKNFVDDFSVYLYEGAKENELNYSLGRLSFQTKNYEESLIHLNKIKFQQVEEKINVRFYYLMNYIELKSYQPAISMLNSIRQFYQESKELPEMFAALTENSLKFFREIIRIEENNKKLDYSVLKEAENAGRYYQKQYILDKMKSLVK